jgi:hypothetical protein
MSFGVNRANHVTIPQVQVQQTEAAGFPLTD